MDYMLLLTCNVQNRRIQRQRISASLGRWGRGRGWLATVHEASLGGGESVLESQR